MGTATKTVKNIVINTAKAASKLVVQKIAEATGDVIRNKIADKINSFGKSKNDTIEPQQKK